MNSLTYEEAARKIREEIERTNPELRPEGQTKFYSHERKTEKVYVFLHGLSNCPQQFAALGKLLHERGYNVLIPRLPFHGEKNPMTESFAKLTARMMVDHANEAVELARGLGDKIILGGLSVSATTVGWLAQEREDIHKAVLFAPVLAPYGVPRFAMHLLEWIVLKSPNVFIWWDFKLKERARLLRGAGYCYPRFPSRVVGETMNLGRRLREIAKTIAPRCKLILLVTSACDYAGNRTANSELCKSWKSFLNKGLERFEFDSSKKVQHDFIDPYQPDQKVALVYPTVIELMEK